MTDDDIHSLSGPLSFSLARRSLQRPATRRPPVSTLRSTLLVRASCPNCPSLQSADASLTAWKKVTDAVHTKVRACLHPVTSFTLSFSYTPTVPGRRSNSVHQLPY